MPTLLDSLQDGLRHIFSPDWNGNEPNQAMVSLQEQNRQMAGNLEMLEEALIELELDMESHGWIRMGLEADREFSRDGLRKILAMSRLMYLKNPLINRGVNIQADYVWAQGINIQATDPDVNDMVQAFLDNPDNQIELTGHQARTQKEVDLQVDGNIFFCLFTEPATGMVRVRTIPVDDIADIICNPEDRRDVWYYKRQRTTQNFNMATGGYAASAETTYYPDMRYVNKTNSKPGEIGGVRVEWDQPVYHVRVGGLSEMRFGLPETYQAIDWAKAYKEFLEDRATLARALSRFAFKMTTPGGKAGIAAAKTRLNTTIGLSSSETNPPPATGSTFIGGQGGATLDPVRLGGATIHPDEGRRYLLMVCAAMGLPETFMGDASVGSLATAKSLDRPTELKFRERQGLWEDIYQTILQYMIAQKQRAEGGLSQKVDTHIDVTFPPLLERDVQATLQAIVSGATLDGKSPAGTMDDRTLVRLILQALGVDQIDEILDQVAPADGESMVAQMRNQKAETAKAIADGQAQAAQNQPPQEQSGQGSQPPPDQSATESLMVRAVERLLEAIDHDAL
jgi:hypothetical protein